MSNEQMSTPLVPTYESLDELLSQRIKIDHVDESYIDKTITICGWIHFLRLQKKLIFGKICDSAKSRLNPIQVVFDINKDSSGYYNQLQTANRGTAIVIKGLVVKSPKLEQPIEIQGQQYYITGNIKDPRSYPLGGTVGENIELLRDLPSLECQTQVKSAIYDVRCGLEKAITLLFELKYFRKVDLPVITFSECEGGCQPMQATLLLTDNKKSSVPVKLTSEGKFTDNVDFSKDFFGTKASLTVSAQLELETRLFLGDVWTMTRAFRGEPSQTSRHLCEFSMVEFEMAFTRSAVDIINTTEELIKFCIKYVMDNYLTHLIFLQGYFKCDLISKLQKYLSTSFPRITHAQCVEMMLDHSSKGLITFKELPSYDEDIGSEHEKYMSEIMGGVVFIMGYPKKVKAFYMPIKQETPEESHGVEHVDSFDLIIDGIELVGGSQRIHDEQQLIDRITELGLDMKPLEFYVDLRKYGSQPHGGMGMGFDRFVKILTGAENVKDCVGFPRYLDCGKHNK